MHGALHDVSWERLPVHTDRRKPGLDAQQKILAESGPLLLIPGICLANVLFRLRAKA